MQPLDLIGTLLSLICTYYFAKAKVQAWLWGIVATGCNTYLYLQKQLPGQALLEIFFFTTMIWGFWQWQHSPHQRQSPRPISRLSNFAFKTLIGGAMVATGVCWGILTICSSSQFPWIEGFLIAFSVCAQGLLCYKKIESWIIWIIVDTVIIGLHITQGIGFHAGLHAVYLVLALRAYVYWHGLLKPQDTHAKVLP